MSYKTAEELKLAIAVTEENALFMKSENGSKDPTYKRLWCEAGALRDELEDRFGIHNYNPDQEEETP